MYITCDFFVILLQVAKKVVLGKPSLAAVGDLSNTPHLDELKS